MHHVGPVIAEIWAILIDEGKAVEPGNDCLLYLEGMRATTEGVGHPILASRSMPEGKGVVL